MKKCIVLLLIFVFYSSKADIHYLDLSDFEKDPKTKDHIDFLFLYFPTFANWQGDWKAEVPKDSIIAGLNRAYAAISSTAKNTAEYYMLLGDISSYLYNLDANKLPISTEELYGKAIALAPKDYRPYWFAGLYLCASTKSIPGIDMFRKAAELAPSKTPDQFWSEFAWAAHLANMPATSVWAMEMAKKIKGTPSYFESVLGNAVRSQLKKAHRDSTYQDKEVWQIDACDTCNKRFFYSTLLGIGFHVDSSWGVKLAHFQKGGTLIQIFPYSNSNKNAEEYPIKFMVIAYSPDDEDNLQHMTDGLMQLGEKTPSCFRSNTTFQVSYEMKNPKGYPEFGGGRFAVLGKETTCPEFPGIKLEMPKPMPAANSENGGMSFYTPQSVFTRISDRMQYVILLDTCEKYYSDALQILKNFLDERIVIE